MTDEWVRIVEQALGYIRKDAEHFYNDINSWDYERVWQMRSASGEHRVNM
jgi:hypothetical protein